MRWEIVAIVVLVLLVWAAAGAIALLGIARLVATP